MMSCPDAAPVSGKRAGRCNRPVLVVVVALLLLLVTYHPAAAQSATAPAYWQYSAPGRIDHLLVDDMNRDGVAELLVAADDVNLSLVGADGRSLWDTPFRTDTPILHLGAADISSDERRDLEIIVATADELIVLSTTRAPLWRQPLEAPAAAVVTIQLDDDPGLEIVVALADGRLRQFDDLGEPGWQRTVRDDVTTTGVPLLTVDDFDQDGAEDLLYTYTRSANAEMALLDVGGGIVWQRPLVSGFATVLSNMRFAGDTTSYVVLGTSTGELTLFDVGRGTAIWRRTPAANRQVTSVAQLSLPGQEIIAVGTAVGRLFGYAVTGQRLWEQRIAGTPLPALTGLSAGPPGAVAQEPFALALTAAYLQANTPAQAELLLVDSAGRLLVEKFGAVSASGLSRITDVNGDGELELLLVDFATIALLAPGIGAGENLKDWDYPFNAEPVAAVVADLDLDGQDELLVGAQDGRLHLISADGTPAWVREFGSRIAHVALLEDGLEDELDIVVVYNDRRLSADGVESFIGRIEVLGPNGRPLPQWQNGRQLPTTITSLLLHDIRNDGRQEIIVGTIDGRIYAYSLDGDLYWSRTLNGSVEFLSPLPVRDNGREALLAGSQARQLHLLSNKGRDLIRANFFQSIVGLDALERAGEESVAAMVTVTDGVVRALDGSGGTLWAFDLEAIPLLTAPGGPAGLLVATDDGQVVHVIGVAPDAGAAQWRIAGTGRVTSLFWGDLDNDGERDVAIGNREGAVRLFDGNGQMEWDNVELGSAVFAINAMRRGPGQQAELVVVTNNGVAQHFRAQANRPPLLVRPQADVAPGRYSVGVTAINVEENDRVQVTLEIFNPETSSWETRESRAATTASPLLWQLEPAELGRSALRYRFRFDDGSNQGLFTPAAGPVPIVGGGTNALWPIAGALMVVVAASVGFYYYQTRTLEARVRRFYGRVRQQPRATLQLLEVAYSYTDGSADYLLNLASRARQDGNRPVASLADGLFLLADRPEAGLPIINGALTVIGEQWPSWHRLETWQATFRVGEALFVAQTLTELSLLLPRLEQTVSQLTEPVTDQQVGLEALAPILTSIRDSERVDLVDDRLVYLNEAAIQLHELQSRLDWARVTIGHSLLAGIAARWSGLIKAEIEGLRGQARLVATLRTRRIVPGERAEVALEIRNRGRAPAENVRVEILSDAAYEIVRQPEVISFLPAGRGRQITGTVAPQVNDRFRLACDIHYDDRHQEGKTVPFGDMVYVLTPQREFEPIINPYAPGTPLRRNSLVFFGREDVFQFIKANTGRADQQNVLILVGQRRTGKTSMLLRLEQHLPPDLVPIYIDCQSLGVVEGIGAFFHDIGWLIADALLEREVSIEVPSLATWQKDPANLFQRQFIPGVLSLLPEGSRLLFVFDEFEAFEDLVEKEILPPTLFTFLRHLMQHGNGLSFVFVGTRRLEEMTTDYWSVLFNIALYRQIGFLPKDAAFRLITEPVSPHIIYDDLALDKIWRVTAGHPYFLQLVCYTLVNRANKRRIGYVTISDVNAAIDEMLRLGEVHFAYMWRLSSRVERIILTTIAHHVDPETPFHPLDLVQNMEHYGIRLQPDEITTALDTLVEREIMREIHAQGTTLYELKIGLIGQWTARNKSISKLHNAMREGRNGTTRRPRPTEV